MTVPGRVFEAVAAMLLNPSSQQHADPEGRALLRVLNYQTPLIVGAAERHRALLFRAAAGFTRVFQLVSKSARGLSFFGAEVALQQGAAGPGSVSLSFAGSGLSMLEAFESCVGEGVERLSLMEAEEDRARHRAPPKKIAPWLLPVLRDLDVDTEWVGAQRLSDGADVLLPIDLCLRRPEARRTFQPPWPHSIGCAAGMSPDWAMLSGLLELIERDAVALWWRGGRRGRAICLEEPALVDAAVSLAQLRQGCIDRRTWLLDITTDVAVPVVAAFSFSTRGDGFCVGTAARPGLASAARAALTELAQTELAIEVVEARRRGGGDSALSRTDLRQLRRFETIHAEQCELLHPGAPAGGIPDLPAATTTEALQSVLDRLAERGLQVLAVDLTRSRYGIPVMHMFCPGLECEPSHLAGPRLSAVIRDTGGGDRHTGGIDFI
jgi:ribosomal protein S12 methylthiotransferase accessory factor